MTSLNEMPESIDLDAIVPPKDAIVPPQADTVGVLDANPIDAEIDEQFAEEYNAIESSITAQLEELMKKLDQTDATAA